MKQILLSYYLIYFEIKKFFICFVVSNLPSLCFVQPYGVFTKTSVTNTFIKLYLLITIKKNGNIFFYTNVFIEIKIFRYKF